MKNTSSLIDYALEQIKAGILDGTYPPGAKLHTQDISNRLGISRTPVVAAVNRLIAQGVAVSTQNKGVTVVKMTPQYLYESTDIRLMIEVFCVRPAIKNIDYYPHIIEEMTNIVQTLKSGLDDNQAARLDIQFHGLFVKLAGNSKLEHLYETNWSSIGLYFYQWMNSQLGAKALQVSVLESERLLELLLAKESEKLEEFLTAHLRSVYHTIDLFVRKGLE